MAYTPPGLGGALAKGLQGYVQGDEAHQERMARREELRYTKQMRDAQLREMNYKQEQGVLEAQVQQALAQAKQAQNLAYKQQTYNYLDAYGVDSNPKHLNALLQSAPPFASMIAQGFGGQVVSFQPLDPSDPRNAQLIAGEGYTPEQVQDPNFDRAKFKARYLKAIGADGSERAVDVMSDIYATTGYADYANERRQKQMVSQADVMSKLTKGKSGTALMQNAEAVAAARTRVAEGTGTQNDMELIAGWEKELGGTELGKTAQARKVEQELEAIFGGLEGFLNTDFSDTMTRYKAMPYVQAIEAMRGERLSDSMTKEIMNINSLIAISDPAIEMTDEATGIFDSFFNNVKTYATQEVGEKLATSAYAAFRNSVRNALFGSALTDAEILAFNEAFGTIKQQRPAVLASFKTALLQVKAKLDTIAALTNPYSAKVRLGISQDQLNSTIRRLDGLLSDVMEGKVSKQKFRSRTPTQPASAEATPLPEAQPPAQAAPIPAEQDKPRAWRDLQGLM